MLASKLGMQFIDTDKEIEISEGKTISEIFTEDIMPSVRGIEAVWGSYGD